MSTADEKRKATVTDEHRAEAALLKAIWEKKQPKLKEAGYGTQGAFGEKFGIGKQAATGHFLNGESALSMKAALGFCKGLDCKLEDFSPRLAAEAFAEVSAMCAGLRFKPVSGSDTSTGWPFSTELLASVATLQGDAVRRAENALRAHLDLPTIPAANESTG